MVENGVNNGDNGEKTRREAAEDDIPSEEQVPPYLRENLPDGKANQVKWYLVRDKSPKEIAEMGYNTGTIRIARSELIKLGVISRDTPPPPDKPGKEPKDLVIKPYPTNVGPRYSATSPEALISTIKLPGEKAELAEYEMGLKAGAGLVVMGVRIAQELTAIAISQARPVMDMAKTMREGEALAAKSAAMEAANMAAAQVGNDLAPYLAEIGKASKPSSGGANPMQDMMMRTMGNAMEPIMAGVMSKMVPGYKAQPAAAQGWKRRVESKPVESDEAKPDEVEPKARE